MSVYLRRSLKYLLYLIVLLVVIFGVMELTSTGNFDRFDEIFLSRRGLLLLVMMVALSAFYPKFGFVRREVKANLEADRDKIEKALRMGGYELRGEDNDVMTFRAASALKRFMALGEEEIRVSADDNYIVVEGLRKEVVKAEFRLKGMLATDER